MTKFFLIVVTCVLATTGIAFLRKIAFPPMNALTIDNVVTFFLQPTLWIGTIFSGVTFLLYLWVLSKYETSTVVPAILGVNLVVLSIFSVLFFGEIITAAKIGGYALIFAGIWLLL